MRDRSGSSKCRALLVLGVALVVVTGCRRKAEAPPQETMPPPPPAPASPVEDLPSSVEPSPTSIQLGDAMPKVDQTMLSVDGRQVGLSDARGEKAMLVVFTCNSCPYAKAWAERLVVLGNEYLGHGVGVLAINGNDPTGVPEEGIDEMRRRARNRGMKFPYVVDATGDVVRAFGASRTPEAYVFDAGGKLVYHGTVDDNAQDAKQVTQQYLRDALAAVVSGQPIPVTETKAMGCSIKPRPKA